MMPLRIQDKVAIMNPFASSSGIFSTGPGGRGRPIIQSGDVPNRVQVTKDRIDRLFSELSRMGNESPVSPDLIKRLVSNEFSFYPPGGPYTVDEYKSIIDHVNNKAQSLGPNCHMLISSMPVKWPNGKVANCCLYVESPVSLGESPRMRHMTKENTSGIDWLYRKPQHEMKYFGDLYYEDAKVQEHVGSLSPQAVLAGAPIVYDEQVNNAFVVKAQNGERMIAAVDICLDHHYQVGLENSKKLAAQLSDPPLQANHVITSATIPQDPKKALATVTAHADVVAARRAQPAYNPDDHIRYQQEQPVDVKVPKNPDYFNVIAEQKGLARIREELNKIDSDGLNHVHRMLLHGRDYDNLEARLEQCFAYGADESIRTQGLGGGRSVAQLIQQAQQRAPFPYTKLTEAMERGKRQYRDNSARLEIINNTTQHLIKATAAGKVLPDRDLENAEFTYNFHRVRESGKGLTSELESLKSAILDQRRLKVRLASVAGKPDSSPSVSPALDSPPGGNPEPPARFEKIPGDKLKTSGKPESPILGKRVRFADELTPKLDKKIAGILKSEKLVSPKVGKRVRFADEVSTAETPKLDGKSDGIQILSSPPESKWVKLAEGAPKAAAPRQDEKAKGILNIGKPASPAEGKLVKQVDMRTLRHPILPLRAGMAESRKAAAIPATPRTSSPEGFLGLDSLINDVKLNRNQHQWDKQVEKYQAMIQSDTSLSDADKQKRYQQLGERLKKAYSNPNARGRDSSQMNQILDRLGVERIHTQSPPRR